MAIRCTGIADWAPRRPDSAAAGSRKGAATLQAAFLYPPTEILKTEGSYSWPGAGFDAEGRDVTIAHHVVGEKPCMLLYTGKVVSNYDTPAASGCRASLSIALNEFPACELKAEHMLHPTAWAGNHAARIKGFCGLIGIPVKA